MEDADFEWNDAKNRSNQKKHGISFDYAARVFSDPRMVLFLGDFEDGEERWRAYGQVCGQAIIMVAHMHRAGEGVEKIRIVSARMATRNERKDYERENG